MWFYRMFTNTIESKRNRHESKKKLGESEPTPDSLSDADILRHPCHRPQQRTVG